MESKDTSASFLNDPRAQSVGRLMTESRFHGDISHHRLFNKLFTCKQDREWTDHFHIASNVVLQHHSSSSITGVTWCLSASQSRNMPTILNKFEFEFYFMNCLQGIAILHRTRSSYRQQKRRFQQAVSTIQENCQMVTYKPFIEPSWNLTKWLFSNYRAVKIRRLKIAITLLTGFVKEWSPRLYVKEMNTMKLQVFN